MVEEPVVKKRARVREEVVVGKETTNRTEKVTESLRRTEVNVERMEADKMDRIADTDIAGSNEDYRADFRRDWESRYAGAGATWETYQPAYDTATGPPATLGTGGGTGRIGGRRPAHRLSSQ